MKWLAFIGLVGLLAYRLSLSTGNLSVGQTRIAVETAATAWQRAKGLSGRADLDQDSGMLFIFKEPARHGFWMRGMNFDLDFIWISGDKVVEITENVGVERMDIRPQQAIDKVLEVNSGFAAEHKIKVGDKVEYNL